MGTRSGNLDPTVVSYMCEKLGVDAGALVNMLNKKSGYLGVSGVSNDSRDLEEAMDAGNKRAKLALDIQYKRIADFIGSYYVYMGGVDAIVFTAGIGENNAGLRARVCEGLEGLGIKLDAEANIKGKNGGDIAVLSAEDSDVKIFVIPTNEELMIALDTEALVSAL